MSWNVSLNVTLRDGSLVPREAIEPTLDNLSSIVHKSLEERYALLALVEKCNDDNYIFSTNAKSILEEHFLISEGKLDPIIKAIAINAIKINGPIIDIIDPI